ncbi:MULTISPECIES: amino acid ABC transporter substrate-binding protein [unclassified Cupriavidus]|jgi:ABC-type amino acid transport substrate-binding protein|uniref:amino acid ABC transporter substrate-binding protein n=1 Tax=unclassified Cupriavidus TaxID=2640874 RepID=UPI001BFFF24E|nr:MULTISPECIES: amino acid ABC transporter substrate-binding protein [unclassified Cupriavidus]MCA3186366.1 amino acid ABC transporter substrate-binding protein [Cupriavidus sp.]MCA3192610.1 amino acid ABC transporter substrate-binding protein [Cupriavidus sp.]MCA3195232.1 amino acid ABC transporter substrate-binding protein [Cupriavidus sp.]MCA3205587.1 amino acid ABC transporter substrate-binding protein [Cupriavidus sp.]MCA3207153.1 amino acid ABC transporter substrate-binding protein [Cup
MSLTVAFTSVRRLLAGVALAAAIVPAVHAQTQTPVLDKIRQTGTITLGYRESALPFSFADDSGKPAGYAVDLCLRVAEATKQKLGLKDLKVRWLPLTPQNRVPAMVNGLADLDCAPNTNTLERQKQVAFSVSHYVSTVRMLVRADSGIKSFADLRGKTVVTSAGSTGDRHVRRLKGEYGFHDVYAKDHGESFLLLETGRAQAFVMDDVLLAGLRAKSKDPSQYVIVGPALSVEQNALMMSKADPEWKQLVDQTLAKTFASPDAAALQKRWFQQPIGTRGTNLALAPSAEVLQAWKHPSDVVTE